MNQPDDEFLASAALAIDQHSGIERRHSGGELQHMLHGFAAGHEVFGCSVTVHAFSKQLELALTALEHPLSAVQLFEALAHGIAQALDLVAEGSRLEVGTDGFALRSPAIHIPPDGGAVSLALAGTAGLAKVHFLSETRADKPARVAHQGPAHRGRALAVVVDVLLRLIRVVPVHFLFEASSVVVVHTPNVRSHDAFQRMKHGARAEAVCWTTPIRARPQIHGVVVSVGEPEPKQDSAGGLEPQRVDEFLSHEAHGRRAEDHDALLVQPNDALIRAKIEQFSENADCGDAACRRGVIGTSPYPSFYGV